MSESERAFPRLIETLHPVEKMVFLAGPRQVGKTTDCAVFIKFPTRWRNVFELRYSST
jgi:predicted AAA+ superfamily ATPase